MALMAPHGCSYFDRYMAYQCYAPLPPVQAGGGEGEGKGKGRGRGRGGRGKEEEECGRCF